MSFPGSVTRGNAAFLASSGSFPVQVDDRVLVGGMVQRGPQVVDHLPNRHRPVAWDRWRLINEEHVGLAVIGESDA